MSCRRRIGEGRRLLGLAACACTALISRGAAQAPYTAEIAQALEYFAGQARIAIPKVKALKDSLETATPAAAQDVYIKSRHEYEQIEVLAPGFPDLDCWIDCRAYAYDHGEGRSDAAGIANDEFQGFHRVEDILFRELNTTASVPYATKLVLDYQAVLAALEDPSTFEFCSWFEGVIGLATEIAAKKMSSEEETYSDHSILIYHANFIGIEQASAPFLGPLEAAAPAAAATLTAAVTTANESVAAFVTGEAPDYVFTPYSQVSTAERAAIQSAAYGLAEALITMRDELMAAGNVTCRPEAEGEEEECVHPQPVEALDARQAGADYFQALFPYSAARVSDFVAAILAGSDLPTLQKLYVSSRPAYEQFETLAPAFPEEDRALDARPDGYEGGETNMEFQGFHRLERMIFRDNITDPAAVDPYTNTTMADWATQLNETYTAFGAKLMMLPESLPAADVFDGVIGVWTEVVHKKISSEEEAWSDDSLMIFYNNWVGGYSQLAPFAAMTKAGPGALETAFNEAIACLEPFHTAGTCGVWYTADAVTDECEEELATKAFSSYSEVGQPGRECIVEKGYGLREAAIEVAHQLGIAAQCHVYHKDSVYMYRHTRFLEVIEPYSPTPTAAEGGAAEGAEGAEAEEATGGSVGLGWLKLSAAVAAGAALIM